MGAFSLPEHRVVCDMLRRGINSPVTTSAGRLFDAVASLLGLRHLTRFEGQAAMELEYIAHAAAASPPTRSYPTRVVEPETGPWIVDWGEALRCVIEEHAGGVDAADIAARFHHTLVEMIVAVAARAGAERVVLSGGCFQNVFLLEHAVARIAASNARAYWHQRVPPNDGGISLGQTVVAAARRTRGAKKP
jgi:hydrogenase maturation protein HypF